MTTFSQFIRNHVGRRNFAFSENESVSESQSEREILEHFIDTYRQLPELWNTTSNDYSNRDKKKEGYIKLLNIYKKVKKDAKIEDVKKKINSLRTNFRKELKKIKDSQRTGSATTDVYEPSSWLFFHLQFLKDVETPDKSRSTINETSEVNTK